MDTLLLRYAIVSGYMNNQTEEGWQEMVEQILKYGVVVNVTGGQIAIQAETDGVSIGHVGCGLCEMEPGYCQTHYLDWKNNLPSTYIWGNINNPDITHVVCMSRSLESHRKESHEQSHTACI